jgi:hypothetical protein
MIKAKNEGQYQKQYFLCILAYGVEVICILAYGVEVISSFLFRFTSILSLREMEPTWP